jgi:hypothetical protein
VIRRRERHPERGAAAIVVALLIGALFGFFALAFNGGLLVKSRSELQNASDSAALAGARSLNGTLDGLRNARQAASDYSSQHLAYDQQVTINAWGSDLAFGAWHLRAAECLFGTSGHDCFEPLLDSDVKRINAVKILNGRDGVGAHNSPLDLPFGQWVGTTTAKVRSAAVAVGGGPGIPNCTLPFTVAECDILNPDGSMKCGPGVPPLVFSNANSDGIGFVNLFYPDDQQAPSGNFVAGVIANDECDPGKFQLGPARLQNGNDFNDKVIAALQGNGTKDGCLIGRPIPWAVTDAGCPGNPIFQNVQDVVGFVEATIVEVTDNQGHAVGCSGAAAPPVTGNPKNAIVVDFPCKVSDPGDYGGGRTYNTSDVRTRLVQ